jgi:hypothetical protein
MNNSKTSNKAIKSIVTKTVEAVKSSYNSITRTTGFINPDGTIAESRDTYHDFKRDVIKSAGFGW